MSLISLLLNQHVKKPFDIAGKKAVTSVSNFLQFAKSILSCLDK